MNSRQRIEAALDHQQPDRIPVDFGATSVTSDQQIEALFSSLVRSDLGRPLASCLKCSLKGSPGYGSNWK